MAMLKKLRLRLRALFFKSKIEEELDEEVRFHLEREIQENIACGMSPEEARYAALRSFGGIERVKEESRDERGIGLLDDVRQAMRFGARMLVKQPGFALIAVLTLALGIGANTALFTVFNALMLKPLPVKDPDSLVSFSGVNRNGGRRQLFSYLDYLDYRDRSTTLTELVAWSKAAVALGEAQVGHDNLSVEEANHIFGQIVSANYFPA